MVTVDPVKTELVQEAASGAASCGQTMPSAGSDTSLEDAAARPTDGTLGSYRWLVCALLFFATTVNYIDRQILSLLKPILDTELGWTNEQFGAVNAAFQGAYAVGLLLFGAFIDRFGTKIGYSVSLVGWSLAAMAHSLVSTVTGFSYARVMLGIAEGGNFPSAVKAVALWFPKRERAFATSLFNSGANVGAIVAPAVVPWIAFTWGWRATFLVAGALGFTWLFFWLPFYDVPEKIKSLKATELSHIRSDGPEKGEQSKIAFGQILGTRPAWAFISAKFLTDPVWWFFLIWLPDFFKKTRHLDLKKSWVHLVAIYAIVTVLSILGGWLTGYLVRRGQSVSRARKTAMFVFACLVVPIVAVTNVSTWGAVLLIGLAGAAHQAWSANLYSTVSDAFPKRAVASVVGIGGMAGCVGGILFPLFTGNLLDRFQASGNVTAGYAVLFGICGVAYLVAFGINHALSPRFEPIATFE